MGSCPQYEALPTPVTPVSTEALTSLLDMIKQVPSDETSRQLQERLQQKVTTAAQTFLAKNAGLKSVLDQHQRQRQSSPIDQVGDIEGRRGS